jgi:hypothetical protein
MQAGLEYLDGKDASVEEGMWLHHTVLHNDARTALHNCNKSNRRQRFFASGNERTAVDLSSNGYVMAPSFRFLRPPAKRCLREMANVKLELRKGVTGSVEMTPFL